MLTDSHFEAGHIRPNQVSPVCLYKYRLSDLNPGNQIASVTARYNDKFCLDLSGPQRVYAVLCHCVSIKTVNGRLQQEHSTYLSRDSNFIVILLSMI